MARKTQHLLLTSWKCLIAHFHRSLLVPQFQVENWLLMCVLGSQDDTAETTLDPTSEQQNCRLGTAASNCAARCLLFMNGIQKSDSQTTSRRTDSQLFCHPTTNHKISDLFWNCRWYDWSPWSYCSKSCGEGWKSSSLTILREMWQVATQLSTSTKAENVP